VVLTAVTQQTGPVQRFALEYASRELRADRQVVLAAVQRQGLALKHASVELRMDPEVVQVRGRFPVYVHRHPSMHSIQLLMVSLTGRACAYTGRRR
jgi:hypothetical protein